METIKIYNIAEKNHITVDCFHLPKSAALSLCTDDGSCFIAIDPSQISCDADEKVKLCHELGHCITGSFYDCDNYCDVYGRHEYRANKWAIKKLIPKEELLGAIHCGITEVWELAKYFGVTENFMCKACEYYFPL